MSVLAGLLLLAVGLTVVIIVQRSLGSKSDPSDSGADVVAYLLLALSVGVAGFSLARLASTAFPGERFVFDPAEDLANALSALVVSLPFAVYFWRRQARRRESYPESPGWTLYLSLIEMVFTTALVIVAVLFLNGLLTDESASAWTGVVVFGGIFALHEYAVSKTPPLSDAGELRRVLGSAIGLVTGAIGLAGVLIAAVSAGYEAIGGGRVADSFHPFVAMLVLGGPLWWYRWARPWPTEPSVPRLTWSVVVTVGSLFAVLGAVTAIAVAGLQYVFAETSPAGQHFELVPVALGMTLAAAPIWAVHRASLGAKNADTTQLYRYTMAAVGFATAVITVTALTIVAFDRALIVGGGSDVVVGLATVLVAGLVVWRVFEPAATVIDRDRSAVSWPRRIYTLGLGAVFGLVAAGALIAAVFVLLRRVLATPADGSLLEPVSILLYTGLSSWYLLRGYQRDRESPGAAEKLVPFEVTIICSHPGTIATKFAKEAKMRVLYRADDAGRIDEAMADEIVAAVANRPALIWVDEAGFRVAPKRQ